MKNRSFILFTLCFLWITQSRAQILYKVTQIDPAVEAVAVNIKGQVAGIDHGNLDKACIWQDGVIFDIPNTEFATTTDIDSNGAVCGILGSTGTDIAFLYKDGQLETIPPMVSAGFSGALGINDKSWITGAIDVQLNVRHVFLYRDGVLTDLGQFGDFSKGMAINDRGWIVGFGEDPNDNNNEKPFIYKGSVLQPLPLLPSATQGEAVDINDSNMVCGLNTVGLSVAVYWDSSGQVHPLPQLTGQISSKAVAINNKGEIVGQTVFWPGFVPRATLWKGGMALLLDDLIDPSLGLNFKRAIAINDSGQILCTASNQEGTVYYLLTPINSRYVVNSSADDSDADLSDGACDADLSSPGYQCTLRAALQQAQFNGTRAFIKFNIPDAGIPRISLLSALPDISFPVSLDATSQPGSGLVELNGTSLGASANGLYITGSNTSIKGFVINGFPGYGVVLEAVHNDTIRSCRIGTDPSGTLAKPNLMGGILISNSQDNVIGGAQPGEGNLISGNGQSGQPRGHGILISGEASRGNRIEGNIIGANIDATDALPNKAGVTIMSASQNYIGGSTSSPGTPPGNLISGNLSWGVAIGSENGASAARSNTVSGNLIGTNASGNDSLSRQKFGVWLVNDADSNTIGGPSPQERNVISGNSVMGIAITSDQPHQSTANRIWNNFIGLGTNGHHVIGNASFGVFIADSPDNQIGGETTSKGNVISGNKGIQVFIAGEKATGNMVAGNIIGPFSDGASLPDSLPLGPGIMLSATSNNLIGSENAQGGNVISGNKFGIALVSAHHNTIIGNKIGTDVTGNHALGNQDKPGIALFRARDNIIGGISSAKRNLISGNMAGMALITDLSQITPGSNGGINGMAAPALLRAQQFSKELIESIQGFNTNSLQPAVEKINQMQKIFPFAPAIAEKEILFSRTTVSKTEGNKILGNYIGTTANGMNPLSNQEVGIFIGPGANRNEIGSTLPGGGNLISANGKGIALFSADNCKVLHNLIGTAQDQVSPLPNATYGIQILQGKRNYIGLGKVSAGNIIAFNDSANIYFGGTQNNFVILNQLTHSQFGIVVFDAYRDQILSNQIWFNQTGISSDGSNVIVQNNSIKDNTGSSTGIHYSNSFGEIRGNLIENNSGGAIRLSLGSRPEIHQNNVQNNQGFGIFNNSPSFTVDARNNWWGDPSGPGGAGPGGGDPVSSGVDFADWLSTPVALVIAAGSDSVFLPNGSQDSLSITLQNWSHPADAVHLTVSDVTGWLQNPGQNTVQLNGQGGAGLQLFLNIPATATGTDNITLNATSQTNPSLVTSDSILLVAYQAQLSKITIYPDSATVPVGETYVFSAVGFDQHSRIMPFQPLWEAHFGSIDSSGVYRAPDFVTIDTVIVQQANAGSTKRVTAKAIVRVEGPTAVQNHSRQLPNTFALFQNYPNPFNPSTTIRFNLPTQSLVRLEVFNVLGQKVATLVQERLRAGQHQVVFNAGFLASGVYVYRLVTDQYVASRKMLLIR
ncbi:MAG: T9SS C-terminal target domain-containing protein [Calditrichaeota bacterium]|nr:MAG: T9SS C-terminal target domain-containing protein [Calditrichota bacterium]